MKKSVLVIVLLACAGAAHGQSAAQALLLSNPCSQAFVRQALIHTFNSKPLFTKAHGQIVKAGKLTTVYVNMSEGIDITCDGMVTYADGTTRELETNAIFDDVNGHIEVSGTN